MKEHLFLAGTLFGSIATIVVLTYIFTIIAAWRIFEKAGEKGWKALIPIYNAYIYFKIADCTKYFWTIIIVSFIEGLVQGLLKTGTPLYYLITTAFSIFLIYLQLVFCENLSKKFGKGIGYTLGLFFFTGIFELILGFGDAKYEKTPKKAS